jgi:hypothetical protein
MKTCDRCGGDEKVSTRILTLQCSRAGLASAQIVSGSPERDLCDRCLAELRNIVDAWMME